MPNTTTQNNLNTIPDSEWEQEELGAIPPNFDIYSPYRVDLKELKNNRGEFDDFITKTRVATEKIKDTLMKPETIDFLLDLAAEFNLSEDQTSNLSRVIRDILLCDLFIGDMAENIVDKLGVPPEEAKQITNKIIAELFAPAIEDIKKMQREKFKNRLNKPTPQPTNQQNINQNNVVDLRNNNQQRT